MNFELIKSVSIEMLIMKRDQLVENFSMVVESCKNMQEVFNTCGIKGPYIKFDDHKNPMGHLFGSCRINKQSELIDRFTQKIDAGFWGKLMDESGMKTFMNSTAREKWESKLSNIIDIPTFNKENIYATFKNLHSNRLEMMEDGLIETFRTLSWNYKTNTPVKIGKRIIIKNYFATYCTRVSDKLDDLLRIMMVIDKKPEKDHREAPKAKYLYSSQSHSLNYDYVDEYIECKKYSNGNLHVKFKRIDIVDQMNLIIANKYPNMLPR